MGGKIELSGPDLEQGVALEALPEGQPFMGHARGEPIVLVRRGPQVHALGAACTHYGASLAEGSVVGDAIRCPWHHACFDLRSGEAAGSPALDALPCYAVHARGGRVSVGAKLAPAARALPPVSPSSVVLVGAGAAGAAAAGALRRLGYAGPLTLVGDEPPSPIDRTNLSKDFLAGAAPEEWVPIRPAQYWREQGVELLAEDPAAALDTAGKRVVLRSGRTLEYGALLLATGAEAVRLPLAGAGQPHVFTLRSLSDCRAIIAALGKSQARRAVVIGASFIGLESAASLRARGVEVDVVERDALPLGRLLGPQLGAFVRALHESRGVRFHTGTSPLAIHANEVELADGRRLPAELVVLGIGVRPRLALAEAAGLSVGDGVLVDELMRTSAPDVYAAGDIARYPDPRLGKSVRIEHWVVAQRQGEAAARAMLGLGAPYRDVPFFWSAHYDATINYVGHCPGWEQAELRGDLCARDATVVYRRGGRALAVATLNRDRQSLAVEAAFESGSDAAVEQALA